MASRAAIFLRVIFHSVRYVFFALRFVVLIGGVYLLADPRSLPILATIASGDAALKADQPAHAVGYYQEALAALPGDLILTDRLIAAATAAHRPEIAIAFLRLEADRGGWTPDRARRMAALLSQIGDLDGAALYDRVSLTGAPGDIPTLNRLARYAISIRDWSTAGDNWQQALKFDPLNPAALYGLGLLALPDPGAFTYLDRLSDNPAYRDVIATLKVSATPAEMGLNLIKLDLWPYADHTLTIALAKNAGDTQAIALLGLIQDHDGHDGWPLIDRALRLAPADGLVNFAAALHWEQQGSPDQAIAILKRAGANDPANPGIAAEIGTLYRETGDITEAAYWYNVAVALAPDRPEYAGLRVLLATFYADEDYDLTGTGLTALKTIATKLPDNADAHASLGRALFEARQPDAARAEFGRALALDPTSSRAHYFLGIFVAAQGDSKGAIAAYLYIYQNAPVDDPFRPLASRSLVQLGYLLDSPSP